MKFLSLIFFSLNLCFNSSEVEYEFGALVTHQFRNNCCVRDVDHLTYASVYPSSNSLTGGFMSSFPVSFMDHPKALVYPVDSSLFKNVFFSKTKQDFSQVGKLCYDTKQDISKSTAKMEFYVSLKEIDEFNYELKINSPEVLKHLIGEIIYNCTKGFDNISSMKERLNKLNSDDYKLTDKKRFSKNSPKETCEYAKSFFNGGKNSFRNSEEAFKKFSIFYMKSIEEEEKKWKSISLNREDLLDMYECAKDFSSLCETLRTGNRSIYNQMQNYCHFFEDTAIVSEVLFVKFSYRQLLYSLDSIKLLDNKKEEIIGADTVIFSRDCLSIPLATLKKFNVHYLRLVENGKIIDLPLYKYSKLVKSGHISSRM